MIELPEALNLAVQIKKNLTGRKVEGVLPPTKPHKFCWFSKEPTEYESDLMGAKLISSVGMGIFVDLIFDNDLKLCINDGVNLRWMERGAVPKDYQLCILFDDDMALVFSVAMYGGICIHDDHYDNEYYLKSKASISPLSEGFESFYWEMLQRSKPGLSMKAFLATEQRFPGIANEALQDILLEARLHPKRKLGSLKKEEQDRLLRSTIAVIREMTELGGRDTEKDLFGQPGGYRTKLSKNTLSSGCVYCSSDIIKESYMGGAIYYCPTCQRLPEA